MVLWWFGGGLALACSLIGPTPFDPAGTGTPTGGPPGPPVVMEVQLHRGRGPVPSGCGQVMSTSCDDLGWITLEVQDPGEGYGLRVELVDGELSDEIDGLYEVAQVGEVRDGVRDVWVTSWIDGATSVQEALSFTVAVTVVDPWGREGTATEVLIEDAGSGAVACGTLPGVGLGLLASLAALAAARRRPTGS